MKIYLDTIGCRLNQAEIEAYARQFRAAGHTLVAAPNEADLAVVNTCAVTSAAVSDSRQKIRQIERAGVDQIIATGCWATLKPAEAAALPNVRQVVENPRKDQLVTALLQTPQPEFELEPLERQPIPGLRLRTRLFIKAQDGCNNRCTFCITTLARGPGRSRPIPEVLNDIRLSEGVQEIVLTGVHLGSWGKDFSPRLHLKDLVRAVLDETDIPRLRLSSLEPWNLDETFFELWQNPRLCPHLHLPLQSGCAETLRRMARKTTPGEFANLVSAVRSQVPEMAVTTDVIVGFPGETKLEFERSLDFVRQMGFSGGHVFTYSARPGTAAARMPEQVPLAERKTRNARMRAVFTASTASYQDCFLGQTLPVLW
ncbi:MAG: MiaB/RimO family radical SAM methylthiotransferase, partial [Anaerolineae bacterium]|nr:MiaB/RimO family radical SAM methylthiotransferase [Anaerolineae bacterium]